MQRDPLPISFADDDAAEASPDARTRLKRFLISSYCAGWMPAWVVTSAFFIFRLRHK